MSVTDRRAIVRHYKGGLYEVVGVAHVEATPEHCVVVYRSLKDDWLWTRPFDDFTSAAPGGAGRPRFVRLECPGCKAAGGLHGTGTGDQVMVGCFMCDCYWGPGDFA